MLLDAYDYKETAASKQLEDYAEHDSALRKVFSDIVTNYMEKTHPKLVSTAEDLKNGDKVKIILPSNNISKKYGINTTPRIVTIEGMKESED